MGWRECFKRNTKLEKKLVISVVVLCCVVLVLFTILLSNAHGVRICSNSQCVRAATHILDTVDPTVDPCQDFYKFVCGTFLKNAFSLGLPNALHNMRSLMNNKLREIVVEPDEKPTHNVSRILLMQRKFYRDCINDTAIEEENDRTFLALLDQITGGWPVVKSYYWKEREFEWSKVMVNARKLGFFYQFYFRVRIFFGTNRTNMIWIKPPPAKDVLEFFHWNHENLGLMAEIATDLGAQSVAKTSELRQTLDFAEQLNLIIQKHYNNSQETELKERSRNVTIKNLEHVFIKIDWYEFLKNITRVELTEDDMVVFEVDGYFKDLYYLLQKTPRRIQANYMAWAIITADDKYMTKKIRSKFQKIRKSTNDTDSNENREVICYTLSTILFKYTAEAEYVRRYTPPSTREYVKEMVRNIKKELQSMLENLSWFDDDTRLYALQHLRNVTEEIGWTEVVYDIRKFDKLFGYDKLKISSDKLVDVARIVSRHQVDRYYKQLKYTRTEEEEEYINTPKLNVNAFYLEYFNKLFLPTPILQGLIFDEQRPHYMNYGSLGSIIGHEFTHAFLELSSEGEVYNDTWWTGKTNRNFKNISQCLDDDYSQYLREQGMKVQNQSLVFEENLADFASVNLAYKAYLNWINQNSLEYKLPGIQYTPNQLFWIMTSTYLCSEPKLAEKKRKNPRHAVSSYRVTGRLRHSPHFAKDFNCPAGTPMNPQDKCLIFA